MKDELFGKNYAVVFSGGGARGAYEMGVWKALNEMDVEISAVAGTSIGAINGALLAQGNFEMALQAWNELTPEMIFNTDLGGIEKYRDIEKMRDLLDTYIDEDTVRNSAIHYVLVTFNLSTMKDETLHIEEIPEGKLVDYIMASADHPVFKRVKIDGNYYIDGGLYNNLPAKPLAERGYKNLIVVDIRDVMAMTYQKFDTEGLHIVAVKPTHDLNWVLNFNRDAIRENLTIGYFDTYKTFGKYISSDYYIKPDGMQNNKFRISDEDFKALENNELLRKIFQNDKAMINILSFINEFRNSKALISVKSNEFFVACLEICASVIEVDVLKEYTLDEIYHILLQEFRDILEKETYLQDSVRERITEKIAHKDWSFGKEDKKVLFAFLLRSASTIEQFYEFAIMVAPRIMIAYLFAMILLNRNDASS